MQLELFTHPFVMGLNDLDNPKINHLNKIKKHVKKVSKHTKKGN